jgi:hypothetical protein
MVGVSNRIRAAVTALVLACAALVGLTPAAGAESFPGLPTYYEARILGYSVQGRAIRAYHMGTPGAHIRAVVLGQMHGDEPAGITVASTILHGPPVKGIDLWVIPTMNPDGSVANTRGNAHGVDLNRNFPVDWRPLTGLYYSGPRALSEPESRAIYAFLGTFKPSLMVSIHQPLDGVDSTDGGARDPAFRNRLAAGLHLPIKAFYCGSFCYGSMTVWLMATQSGSPVTIEFPAAPSAAELTAVAPPVIISAFGGSYDSAAAHNPIMGIASGDHGSVVSLYGWAYDGDLGAPPVAVAIKEGTTTVWSGLANRPSTWIAAVKHMIGTNHGFAAAFAARDGIHHYCVVAYNRGWGSADTTTCAVVAVRGAPRGVLESTRQSSPGHVTFIGWAYDPDDTAASIQVQVREGAALLGTYPANVSRPDVNAAQHLTGAHGYSVTIPATVGTHSYGINSVNIGSTLAVGLVRIGNVTITVTS